MGIDLYLFWLLKERDFTYDWIDDLKIDLDVLTSI